MRHSYQHGFSATWLLGALAFFLFIMLLVSVPPKRAATDNSKTTSQNQVSLSAEASREIEHDLMRVTLYTQVEGEHPAQLAKITTEHLNAAIGKAREVKAVNLQSGNRSTSPVYSRNGEKILKWRESAELHLESQDMTALATLISELLSDELTMGRRSFSVSREKRVANEDSLTQEAIAAFRARAQLAAEALGYTHWRLIQMNLDGRSIGARPLMARAQSMDMLEMASADNGFTSQQIEAGRSTLSVRVDGVIEVFD